MQEIWKPIPYYENLYEVSNLGNVKSLRNKIILKPFLTRGYFSVNLSKDGICKTFLIHRLVALAFIPNPNNYKEVNHKDEIKTNNNVDNLEWCTREYNMSYGKARFVQGVSCGNPVLQIYNDIVIAWYYSSEFASKITGIDCSSIIKCCKGKRVYAGGYKWKYSDKLFD